MPQCVVVAGGLGTRLSTSGITTPKLLLEVNGKTLLSIIVNEIVVEGYTKILFCLGFESKQIIAAIKELNVQIDIEISIEESRLGTLGALEQARNLLDDFFTVLMGDIYLSCTNIGSIQFLCEKLGIKALTLCKFTDHPLDSDLVELDNFGRVLRIFRAGSEGVQSSVNTSLAGVSFLAKELIDSEPSNSPRDITRNLFMEADYKGFDIQTLFHQGIVRDLGTPERFTTFVESQRLSTLLPLSSAKNILLLDRDGTLNKENGHISNTLDIHVQSTGLDIAKVINNYALNAFLITNQPVISRGAASAETVIQICSTLLKKLGIWQADDHIYICPHYPESGFEGEVVELKIHCGCRKPNPALLLQAANDHSFRLTDAIMIGDSHADVIAALHVGAKVIHLHTDLEGICKIDSPLGKLVSCILFVDIQTKLVEMIGQS